MCKGIYPLFFNLSHFDVSVLLGMIYIYNIISLALLPLNKASTEFASVI